MSGMAEKLKRNKTTAADLPEEVIRKEILTRVPIKDVVRFKSVSKTWLALFSQPQFIKDHFTRCSTRNPVDYDCLVAKKHNRIVIFSRYKETFLLPCDHFDIVGSVRGLVCLRGRNKLSLWNPAIHQSKEFSLPPYYSRYYWYYIGFGFDSLTSNYKVVVLSRNLSSATVYLSNSDSWIDVSVPDLKFLKTRQNRFVIVKDCPYWTFARHTENRQRVFATGVSLVALKFDAGTNQFKLLPEFNYDASARRENHAWLYVFVDMNDFLTLMVYDPYSSNCVVDIFSLHGEEGCYVWSKMYGIGPIDLHTRNSWNVTLSQGFKYGSEIVYYNDDGMFFCYDHETDTIKRLVATTYSTVPCLVSCFRYTPSLVFLEGMKSVHLTTQTRRTPGRCFRTPRRLINSLRD